MNYGTRERHTCLTSIATEIQRLGFQCVGCGECCTDTDEGSALVMVSPDEIRAIMKVTGLLWNEIAEPFPEMTNIEGKEVTFEWTLIRHNSQCRFLIGGKCSVYDARPWICRTYPFNLEDEKLSIPSLCQGIGLPICKREAQMLADDLLNRAEAERLEEDKIAFYLQYLSQSAGTNLVIDGEGIKSIYG